MSQLVVKNTGVKLVINYLRWNNTSNDSNFCTSGSGIEDADCRCVCDL